MHVKTDIAVRAATVADVSDIWNVLWTTWTDTYGPLIPIEDLESYFEGHYSQPVLSELLEEPGIGVFIAEVGGSIAGTMITKHDGDVGRFSVSSLYVLPNYQGWGVGTRLLTEAEHVARRYNAHSLWLGVMAGNVKSVGWYERIGFRFDQRQSFAMGKTTVEHLIGFKTIEGPGLS